MTTTHAPISWTAGDDWQINATLQDETSTPYDLSGSPEILWALMDSSFKRILDEDDVSIVVTDAVAGKVSINIPAEKTSPLPGGRYTDVIRIVYGGITSTLSYGNIQVAPDPWLAPDAVAAQRGKPRLAAVAV